MEQLHYTNFCICSLFYYLEPKNISLMKKTIFIIAALLLCFGSLMAQQVGIEKSEEFDEPEYGWNKLLQLKNGNTFFFHSTKKDGIEVVVYNKQRKQIADKTLESKLWDVSKMRNSKIVGLYEINGEPVIFIVQADDRQPTLYRMRINGTTGAIVKEDELGHLPPTSIWYGYAMAFGNADASNIIIEKDPQSDCYAVIFFNGFAHNRSERIKVVHYDGNHKILNSGFYESPNGKFKYLRYIGAVVDGNKRVFVTTYGHNGNSSDVLARVIVSRLNVGDSSFTHNLLDFSEDLDDTKAIMVYNHNNNRLQLMTLTYTETKHRFFSSRSTKSYLLLLSYLDPESLSLINVKQLVGEKVNEYGIKNIDKDYEYSGIPEQMILNKDNTTTILAESTELITTRDKYGRVIHEKTILGPIGISELSDTGAELRGYAINKKQQADGNFPLLYMSGRSKGIFAYPRQGMGIGMSRSNTNEFFSYDYVNAPNGRYVIFNDLPGNADKDEEDESRKTVKSVSSTNTMCYKLNDPKMDKFYLFGEPDDKKASTFCYIESSDYNKDINTYATMIVERDGRSKSAKIAWITFL